MSMKVYCDVCATFIPSAALVEGHNKGKKHQRLLKVQEEKEKAGKRSVYVRNFDTSATIEEDLKHHFSQYGDVKNVFLDKEQGVYAIVEFELEESVAKVLGEQDPPLLKGRKLRVKVRTVPKEKKHSASSSSSPTGRKPRPHAEQELAPFLEEEVITKLRSISLVSEQVGILVQELGLTTDDLKLRQLVCDLLQEVFKEAYPKVQVVPFGSTVTGLGWKGCDLDLCLVTESSISDGTPGTVSVDVSESVDKEKDGEQDYSLIIDMLRSLAPGCVHIIPILSAKCPLVKFTHQPSGLACDLSINNRLGICNSELLKCYMSMDPRVIHLVFAVRTWAKAKGVCEKGQLSNYALTLMVLYFLQTTTPSIIPSVQDPADWSRLDSANQTAADATHGAVNKNDQTGGIVDGWDCAYLSDVTRLSPSKNIKTLDLLLEEFFNFYGSEFDYGNCVVNVRRGKRTTVSQVLQELDTNIYTKLTKVESSSPPPKTPKKSEFKVTPLCIQDPFELTHNVAQNISVTALKQFIQHMMEGKIVCKNFVTQKNCKGSLLKLLSVSRRAKRKKSPSYSFFVPFHSHEKVGECPDVDGGSVTNTEGMFCNILKILQNTFGVVCEVTGSDYVEPAVHGTNFECTKVPCKVLGNQEKEQVLCSSENSSTSHPEAGGDGSPTTMETGISGAKRKAQEKAEESTIRNPAKKLRCDNRAENKHEATCTAQKNTWKSHRREKRQHKTVTPVPEENDSHRDGTTTACKEPVDPTSESLREGCESSSPVIVFKLTVSACEQQTHGCSVSIEGVFAADAQVLGNFFGVFKKHVTSHLV